MFYDLYDEPELIHDALDLITNTMIVFQESLPKLNDRAGTEGYYVHRAIYGGSALLKLDTETAMLSEEMFEEFCAPYNNRVLSAVGGGSIHFCGGGKVWPSRQMVRQNISCLNFGNPEMQDVLGDWRLTMEQKKICVVGYGDGQPYAFLKEKLDRGMCTGVTLLTKAESFEQAQEILALHRSRT